MAERASPDLAVTSDYSKQSIYSDDLSNEHQPLLTSSKSSSINSIQATPPSTSRTLWLQEIWLLFKRCIPVMLGYILQSSLQTSSILIVGRLSPEPLATSAFSYMFAEATAWLIGFGGSTALDTLASSTYTGSGSPHDLGVLLQRGFVVFTAFYAPVALLWTGSAPVFRFLGQEDYICTQSARFLTALIPGGLGFLYFEAMKKYLQAQGIMRAGTYVLVVVAPINVLLNYLFIYNFSLGLLGAPLATGLSYWLCFLLLLLYTRFFTTSPCWGGFSTACFHNIGQFSLLSLLGILQCGTEWWAFEIVALAAGHLGTIPLAAQSVVMTTDNIVALLPFGLGVATSSRVGNLLGARDARGAERSASCATWLGIGLGCVLASGYLVVRGNLAKLFTDDGSVRELVEEVIPWLAAFQIADSVNSACAGSVRGTGRQHLGALVNVVGYYVIALPTGLSLAFKGWGLVGLWIGQCLALSVVGFIQWLIVWWTDWEVQVARAFERMYDQGAGRKGVEEEEDEVLV